MKGLDTRRRMRLDSTVRMLAVLLIVVFGNMLGTRHFGRVDLTADRVHTLSQAGRVLMARLEKPLVVKVFFTKGLEAPYNNHERAVVDKLQELRAWSRGRMEVTVVDPTDDAALQEEAARLGVVPIDYAFRSQSRSELKKVWMGVAFIYGDRQLALPAVTQVGTIEYDLARSIKSLVDGKRKVVGYVTGHDEPDLLTARGPLEDLREDLLEAYELKPVRLDGDPEDLEGLDALLVVGPQGTLGVAEQFRLDQLVVTGTPVAFFLSNYRPDLRTMRTVPVIHGLEGLLGAYEVELNRDLVADRVSNGKMRFPVRQGRYVVQVPINYPLIPQTTDLAKDSVVVKDLDTMQFPFVSSIDVPAELEPGVQIEVLARSGRESGRIKNVQRLEPAAYQRRDPSEEVGAWPLIVTAQGPVRSFFAGRELPASVPPEAAAARVDQAESARLLVAGSADFTANNLAFMVNLVDWLVQDEELIRIRSKTVAIPVLEPQEPGRLRALKLANLLGPGLLLLAFGVLRRSLRRRRVA